MNSKQPNENTILLTILVNGIPMKVDANSIRKQDRKVFHGEYKGKQVNSPAISLVGESAIIWPDASESDAVAMTKADLGVLSTEFLKSEGFTVKAA